MKQALRIMFIVLLLSVISLQIVTLLSSRQGTRTVQICPTGAISMQGSKAVINSEKCIGCQRCVLGIPVRFPQVRNQVPQESVSQPQRDSISSAPLPAPPPKQADTVKPKDAARSNQPQAIKPSEDKETYQVNSAACIGCQLCVSACPTQAISMVNGKAVIDKEKCINCGICFNGDNNEFQGCPVGAIKAP